VSGEEERIAEYVAKRMNAAGLDVETIGGNVVGRSSSGESRTLVFNSHMDTVPAGNVSLWTFDPFEAHVEENRVYGRGAADMKGGLAAMILAAEALKRSRIAVKGELILTAVVLEEVRRKLTDRKGVVELLDKGVIKGKAAVICEPTNLRVSIGHRSRTDIEIVTEGKAAHGSMPDTGVNAIEKMAKIILALKQLRLGYDPTLGRGTMNVGVIEGGTKPNVVPESCRIVIDRRLTMGETPERAVKEFEKIVAKLSVEDPDLRASVNYLYGWRPTLIPADEEIVRVVRAAVETTLGFESELVVSRFHTDGGYIHHMAKMPIVVFGPGDEALAHTTDEYIEIDQVVSAAEVYAATIQDFLKPRKVDR